MRQTDCTVVLYHPEELELALLMENIRASPEVRWWHVLCSGTSSHHLMVEVAVGKLPADARGRVLLSKRFDNLGFASGHNLLLKNAFEAGAERALVLNADVRVEPGAIPRLCEYAGELAGALVGPSLMQMTPEGLNTARADTLGIVWTRSARHFDIGQGDEHTITPGRTVDVQGISGACLLVSRGTYTRLVSETGHFFDDTFLAYREDAELGVRASLLNIPSVAIECHGFAHVRKQRGSERGRSALVDLLGVRNRLIMRFKLGRSRPGNPAVAHGRDVLVVLGCLVRERQSLPGILEAWRLRKYQRRALASGVKSKPN